VKHLASALSVTLVATGVASAQIQVDGTVDAAYGAALSVQNTSTGFGDSNDPSAITSGGALENFINTGDWADPGLYDAGSEIDAVYGRVEGGFLHIFIAGNLEDNFNKLEIFIDSEAGVGQNTIVGANLPVAVDAFCCGGFGTTGGALQNMDGMTFDAGFSPDYYMTTANGNESTGDPLAFPAVQGYIATTHFAELNNGPSGDNVRVGGVLDAYGQQKDGLGADYLGLGVIMDQNNNLYDDPNNPSDFVPAAGQEVALQEFFEALDTLGDPTNVRNHRDMENTIGMLMAVNNSNGYTDDGGDPAVATGGGVIGDSNGTDVTASPEFVALAAAVTTGFEYAIPLSAIGNPTGDIKITAMINNGSHDYLANQVAGEGILQGNLGGDGAGGWTGTLAGIDFSTIAGDQFVTISQGLEGDLNGDGFVGIDDLNIVLGAWNQSVPPGNPLADPSGDGFVGIDDLNTVLGNWNAGTPPTAAAVPEPATLALLAMGGLAMLKRRH
jgi:PEP-CTERM motif